MHVKFGSVNIKQKDLICLRIFQNASVPSPILLYYFLKDLKRANLRKVWICQWKAEGLNMFKDFYKMQLLFLYYQDSMIRSLFEIF